MAENETNDAPDRSLTCPWWIVGVLVALFALLAFIARGRNTLRVDLEVSEWVQSADSRFAEAMAQFGDVVGGSVFALAMLVVSWVGLAALKQRRDLWFVVIAALGRVGAMALKGLLDSPRPTAVQVETSRAYSGLGFPSGHATTAAIVVGTIAYLIARRVPGRTVHLGLIVFWMLGIAITAYARIWHGAHWFTDTLGGATVGIIVVLVAANLSAAIATTTPQSSGRQTGPPQTPTQ